jgi:hypothetical protein
MAKKLYHGVKDGQSCTWDVTFVDNVTDAYLVATSVPIGADFAGATGASAPAQFLQRGLSPLTYDAARDGRGGRKGRGREGRRRGGTFSPRTLESKSAPMSVPIATFGSTCAEDQSFIRDIDKRISATTSDPCEAAFLFQRVVSAVQQYYAICFAGTFQSASDASHTRVLFLLNFCPLGTEYQG